MTDLKKLLDEATPGPWHHGGSPVDNPYKVDVVKFYAGGMGAVIADMKGEPEKRTHDAALICAAVNAVPELLALREEVGRLRAVSEYPVVVEVHMPDTEHDLDKSLCDWAEVTPGVKFYCRLQSWRPQWKYVGLEFEAHSEAMTFAQRHHPMSPDQFLKAQTFCQVVIKGWDQRARAALNQEPGQ